MTKFSSIGSATTIVEAPNNYLSTSSDRQEVPIVLSHIAMANP